MRPRLSSRLRGYIKIVKKPKGKQGLYRESTGCVCGYLEFSPRWLATSSGHLPKQVWQSGGNPRRLAANRARFLWASCNSVEIQTFPSNWKNWRNGNGQCHYVTATIRLCHDSQFIYRWRSVKSWKRVVDWPWWRPLSWLERFECSKGHQAHSIAHVVASEKRIREREEVFCVFTSWGNKPKNG